MVVVCFSEIIVVNGEVDEEGVVVGPSDGVKTLGNADTDEMRVS